MDCKWLPELILCDNLADYSEYEEILYNIFKKDFIDSNPKFKNKKVYIRKHPTIDGKEQAFFHVTTKNNTPLDERFPDPRRCERIKWIRKFIENYLCNSNDCPCCDGIKVFEEQYKNTIRIYFLLEEEKYVVIIERRADYFLLVTAYYIYYQNTMRKLLNKYTKYKAESASKIETLPETPSTTSR